MTRELDPILERDPAGVYAAMDEATRERYRRACQELAEWSEQTPTAVAQEAIRLSEEHGASEPRGHHVGAWLIAEGRVQLEAHLGCRVPWTKRAARTLRRHARGIYVGALSVLTVLALIGLERLLAAHGVASVHRFFLVVLLASPFFDCFNDNVDLILLHLMPAPEPLPRLEPEGVFARDARTLVITPLLISSAEDIEAQLRKLEINYLGNVDPHLLFALLTDFRDAPEKELPAERELLERLERGIRELNARHGYSVQPRFFYFHRERRWNPVAGRWMGWERKRGKLEEFNRLLLGARDTSYMGTVPEALHSIRYILTLDADTHLLPGHAARMVATLHHPLNQARFDASGRRVSAGYSLLQPHIEDGPSRAQWLASGGWSVSIARDRKNFFIPSPGSLHQSLFATGQFYGKGLYDVAAFTRSLEGRIPENVILSHDKLEGMYARVAFVHDATLFESRPKSFQSFCRINHRWTRGDWQLLPWILPWVPTREGRLVANTLSLYDRWNLLKDLRQSLGTPLSLFAIVYGWLCLPSSSVWAWSLGALLWICRRALVATVSGTLVMGWRSRSVLNGLRYLAGSIPAILMDAFIQLERLLPLTALSLDAIGRTLYRLAFDRRRMLDWTTHAQSSREGGGLRSLLVFPEVWGAVVLALGIGGALAVFNPGALPWASPLLLVWIPLVVLPSRSMRASAPVVMPERDVLQALARGAWEQYARMDPTGRELPRTAELTPTDLALWLVAPLSAYHLGYLALEELVSRLGESLATVASLERHRGHPFARYDAAERRPVGPWRISTAESGVLAAALVVVERGLQASRGATSEEELLARLGQAEARAREQREGMDFAFLYDSAAELFRTGYDVESQSLDGAHHGQLTSGAMLAGFVAIARRQIPLRHWVALTESDQRLRAAGAATVGHDALAEQLLPTLFLWFPPATLLSQAALATVDAGLPPAPAAPHLSALALRFRPARALADLRRAAEAGASGPRDQAMSLAAVANLTCDDVLVQHFHQHWQTGWVEGLVYETKDFTP
ncbi:hypothetical protein ACN28E_19320 [Archangium lansingense]|uniref:hypothetical protein n=1 Tax=Archangium lansingense TaxID=2995310 RepID=UPI003B7B8DEF